MRNNQKNTSYCQTSLLCHCIPANFGSVDGEKKVK